MPLSQKHKIIFWSLLVLVMVFFLILYTPYLRVKSVVNTYNRWTDPAVGRGGLLKLFIASKYGTSKLKKIVAKDCNTIAEYPDGRTEYGKGYGYINSLTGRWFVLNVDRIILSGPIIEPNGEGYMARMRQLFYERSDIELAEVELSIKKYGGKYLISAIKWTQKNPTDEELSNYQNILKVRRYDPDKGFGRRYNETYKFSEPHFSPDGTKLVFSSLSPGSDIYIVNLDGSGLKRLTKTKYWEVLPQFTPDGKNIMFMSDKENYGGEYYLTDLNGSNYRRLVPDYFGVSEACFSPDGKYVAFTSQKGLGREVYIMDADGSDIRQLTKSSKRCSSLFFSTDGKKLFFVQRWGDYDRTPPLTEEIFSINVDGTGLKQLTHARAENAHNKIILDVTNNHVFFLRVTYEYDNIPIDKRPNNREVWQMSYNGSEPRKILGGGMSHGVYDNTEVLPDGKSIVFVDDSERQYSYRIYAMELNESGKTRQLINGEVYSKITISPDGKYIAYMILPQLLRNAEARGLGVVSVDGKESWTTGDNWKRN
jgi:Tol biopolymer transport system component